MSAEVARSHGFSRGLKISKVSKIAKTSAWAIESLGTKERGVIGGFALRVGVRDIYDPARC